MSKKVSGFSVIEIIIALTIISVGLLPTMNLINKTKQIQNMGQIKSQGILLAQSVMENKVAQLKDNWEGNLHENTLVEIPEEWTCVVHLENEPVAVPGNELVAMTVQLSRADLPAPVEIKTWISRRS